MIFKTQYPNNETKNEVILTSLVVGAFFYMLLIIYQPFGTSNFEHSHKYLLLFPYAVITGFSFCLITLLLLKQKRNWTVGSELLKAFLTLLLISFLSYLYNTLFLSKVSLSFENYLYMFAYTLALGFPVSTIYILARYIYLSNKNKYFKNATTIAHKQFILSENHSEINERQLQQKLCIISDYANFSIEIRQEDFVFAESADNYCILHFYVNGILQKEMIRISLSKLLNQIQTDTIRKVHRSFIVNLTKVVKFRGNSSGYKISLENIEKELIVSRHHIDLVLPILEQLVIHP